MQEEGLSLLAQSNRLHEYADRKDLEVIKTFEIVESSTHGQRKQFMEMINFCKRQKETIAIVADTVDRVQRSFKESVLLDELMRQDKIELHFYREGMVLNSKSTSVDIMRWDFSVMGAKAYVLQLSENVRRSTEQKNRNGEITGQAPIGYENYTDERGKKFIRPKESEAVIIRKCYEIYSLGNTSVSELQHYANMMGLRNAKGGEICLNSMHNILGNPFYYGEMRTKRGIMPHVYKPIVSKELWDLCQKQKAIRGGQCIKKSEKNFLFRGLVTCGITNKICQCELKKGIFSYVACWHKDKTRMYIREEEFTSRVSSILNCIRLPENIITELQQELKTAKASERKFNSEEIKRLKTIFTKLSSKEKKFLEPLIQRAAYMKIQLEDYEKDLLENGYVEMFSQSDKQAPYERERPVARLYTTLNGNYQKIMKQLSDHIEHVPVKEKSDGFEEFVNSR